MIEHVDEAPDEIPTAPDPNGSGANGEAATVTPADADRSSSASDRGAIPLGPVRPYAHTLRNGISHVFPVPYWVHDWHMVSSVVGLLVSLGGLGGLVLRYREHR